MAMLTVGWLCVLLSLSSALSDNVWGRLSELLGQDEPRPRIRPHQVLTWPLDFPGIGHVSGLSVRPDGHPVIFHRGPRVWDDRSFNDSEHFQHSPDGPIMVDTVVTIDRTMGTVLCSWGAGTFFLPHGITVDTRGNTWLTDVALHQVFKFAPGATEPELVLGRRFQPGAGRTTLCKPTSVAVASMGLVFVADGYCNSRIVVFSPRGHLVRIISHYIDGLTLNVPHGLTLLEQHDMLCIADRENRRVACARAGLRDGLGHGYNHGDGPSVSVMAVDMGRVFDVASAGEYAYAVTGPTSPHVHMRGYTMLPLEGSVVDRWEPLQGFRNPHNVAVCPNMSSLYVAEMSPARIWKFVLTSAAD